MHGDPQSEPEEAGGPSAATAPREDRTGGARTVRQVHDALLALEEDEGFFERVAGGQRFWHQVRHNLYVDLLQRLGFYGKRPTGRLSRPWTHTVKALKRELSAGPKGLRPHRWEDLRPADLLVFNHERHVLDGGREGGARWICPYTQPLLDDDPAAPDTTRRWSRVVIQDAHEGVHMRPAPAEGLHYISWQLRGQWARTAGKQLARLGRRDDRVLFNRRERAEVRGMAEAIGHRFGLTLPPSALLGPAQVAAFELTARTELYERLLDRVRPRAVVVVVGYGYRTLPLTRAARRRGIPTLEMQHGLIGPTHLAYNFAPGRRPLGFPDTLMTFGDFWRDITPGLPVDAEHAPAVGYGWLDRQRVAARQRASTRAATRGSTPEPRLLVISQGTIGRDLGAFVAKLVASAAPGGRLPGGLRLRYKLHPGELAGWRQRYPELAWASEHGVDVVDRPTPIYDELAGADAVLGVYSTAVFEALAFGLPTFIAKLPGWQAAAPLVAAGAATAVSDVAELRHALEHLAAPPEAVRERVWRPNARANFHELMERVLGAGGASRQGTTAPSAAGAEGASTETSS